MKMRRLRLVWQIYIPFLLIAGASVLALAGYASHSFRSFHMERSSADLEARGLLVEDALEPLLRGGDAAAVLAGARRLGARMGGLVQNSLGALLRGESASGHSSGAPASASPPPLGGSGITPLQARVTGIAQRAGIRVTVINSSGLVLADSHKNPALMDNHAGRPEIALALGGTIGRAVRFSKTLEQNMIYVAVPVVDDGTVIAVVRSSLPLTGVEKAAGQLVTRVAGGALAVALLLALASLLISRRVSRPLEDLREAADRFAHGEFAVRVDPSGSEEVAALALSMNRMAVELDERIRALAQ